MPLMRALGPGSVSSFLKTILDVVFYALWVGLGSRASCCSRPCSCPSILT